MITKMFTRLYYPENNLAINSTVNMKFNWQNKTLMVIEDDYVSFLFLKDVLSKTRIKIKRAISLKQSLDFLAANNNKIDLIIVNASILGENVYKSILEIKRLNQLIPIIAKTDQYSVEIQSSCIEAGCDTYIYSHIDVSQLLITIDELLDKSSIISSLILKGKHQH
ncbi:MAG: response regulator [Bacteroidales bacterium]|nr:MAG: response regulator [Bacteroidales bacterium]